YAGDAEIADLSPGAKRLVSFAVDLDTEVSAESTSSPELITAVKIDRGTLIATRKLQRERDYTVVNRSGKKREVLIEYPKARDWTLIAPEKPAESTPELYRFDVTTDSGGRAALAVKEERMVSQTVALSNIDSQTILYYSNQRASGAGVKRALSTLTNLKSALADLVNQRRAFQDRVDAISKDQSRIRSNMNALQRDSDLYRRYVTILASQEDELAAAAQRIEELSGRISTAQKQIDDFLSTLTVS
ncbi:MAG TPA: hypothetical protein VMV68_02830, partial [Spirochaetia bacterium]|nr:hypothetical protein [Spirochaetia bacterium]